MPNTRVREVSRLLSRRVVAPASSEHTAKTKQAWRYPGGNVVRAPSTRLGSAVYTDPKDPGYARRKQESNFFLTINTNKAPVGDELELGTKHLQYMLDRLRDPAVLASYLKFGPKDSSYIGDKYSDVVVSVDWNGAVETGDVLKRLHAHVWLKITHYSQIQIDVHKLTSVARRYYNDCLPVGSPLRVVKPYVHVKLLPQSDWATVIMGYVQKGMVKNGAG